MIIADTAGETIQIKADAASSITVTAYGIEAVGTTNTYKKLGQAQAGVSTSTLYTVPSSTTAFISQLVITNTSSSKRTFTIYHVPNAGSAGDDNCLFKEVELEGNQTYSWGKA